MGVNANTIASTTVCGDESRREGIRVGSFCHFVAFGENTILGDFIASLLSPRNFANRLPYRLKRHSCGRTIRVILALFVRKQTKFIFRAVGKV